MKISIIVAVAKNNVIGSKGNIPWHLPADLIHFKKTTMGHTILMGQATFESIGKVLPGRTNLILSHDPKYRVAGGKVFNQIKDAIDFAESKNETEMFVIGGASVYDQLLPITDKIYLTEINLRVQGDRFFPKLEKTKWSEVTREKHSKDEKNKHDYDFVSFLRKK